MRSITREGNSVLESVQRPRKFPSVFVNQIPLTARHGEHTQDGLPGFIVAEASVAPDDFEQMIQGSREVAFADQAAGKLKTGLQVFRGLFYGKRKPGLRRESRLCLDQDPIRQDWIHRHPNPSGHRGRHRFRSILALQSLVSSGTKKPMLLHGLF